MAKITARTVAAAAPTEEPEIQPAEEDEADGSSGCFVVEHTMVGPFPKGRVIHKDEIESIEGANLSRLINLGAIRPTNRPVTAEPLQIGPENNEGHANSPKMQLGREGEETAADTGEDEGEQAVDYSKMKVLQLTNLAKERDIDIEGMSKAEIVSALEEYDAAQAAQE